MLKNLLIVEDELEVQILIKRALSGVAADLCVASTAKEGRELLSHKSFSLIILDISLPDQNGLELFMELQANEKLAAIPVVFLSGNAEVPTKVAAFAMGADDYVMKPFNALELRARIEAKLKRFSQKSELHPVLRKGELQLDAGTLRVFTLASGEPSIIHLTPLEFKLIFYLAKNEEHVFSRTQLLDAIWGDSSDVFDRTIDVHISSIRKKLGKLSIYIESIPGAGYRFSTSQKEVRSKTRVA